MNDILVGLQSSKCSISIGMAEVFLVNNGLHPRVWLHIGTGPDQFAFFCDSTIGRVVIKIYVSKIGYRERVKRVFFFSFCMQAILF